VTDPTPQDRRQTPRSWPEARNALLRQDYPLAHLPDLLARVNAIPAPLPVRSVDCLITQAAKLGVRRVRQARPQGGVVFARAIARRTPAREALLRELRRAYATYPEIEARLNELPGPRFDTWLQVRRWARALKLELSAWGEGGAPLPKGAKHVRKWSDERLALLRETVTPGRPPDWRALQAAINALPGFAIEQPDHIRHKARGLGLLAGVPPAQRRPARPPRVAVAKPAPKPARPAPAAKPAPRPKAAPARRLPEPPAAPALLSAAEVDAKLAERQARVSAALASRNADCHGLALRFRLPLREVIRLQREAQRGGAHP
jgi:hypothetical protein